MEPLPGSTDSPRAWLRWCVPLLLLGCSSSLSTMQPARTLTAGEVRAVSSVSITPPIGMVEDTWDSLHALADGELDQPNQAEGIAELATQALVQPPSLDGNFALAVGLADRLELNARVGTVSAGAGFRIQWMRRDADGDGSGFYGALGANVDIGFNSFPLERFTDRIDVRAFRRVDYSVPLVVGYSSEHVNLWAGPKLVISSFDAKVGICLGSGDACGREAQLHAEGRARYYAGHFGVAFGGRRFWLAAELTIARARIEADLDIEMPRRTTETRRAFEGRVVTPALGLMLLL